MFLCSIYVSAQFNTDNLKMADEAELSQRFTYNKLKVYPIRANDNFRNEYKDIGKFSSLEEAIKNNKIKITEVGSSGSVNTLYAENLSDEPIYIIAGEIVKGGKQDRIIGEDVVLAPGENKNLDAYCVEHGRWSTKESGNNFSGYMNISSKEVRKAAAVNKNQSLVWEKVAGVTRTNNAESSTGSYTELENSEEYNKKLSNYLQVFKSAWDNDPEVVGVVAVTGNEIIGCDIFASHDLFVNSYNNLIHSYITEALTNGENVTLSRSEVQKYLDQFLKDESKQKENLEGKGMLFEHDGRKIHITKF